MARGSKRSKQSWWRFWRASPNAPVDPPRRVHLRVTMLALAALVLSAAGAYGMFRLDGRVRRELADGGPPRIVFTARPAGMAKVTEAALAGFADVPWSHPTLCMDIAGALKATGWVREVERVHRYPDRRVEVTCSFREPLAMVQAPRGCCLVDADCVRLPGWYPNDPRYKLIVGVEEAAPGAGEKWAGAGVRTAVELVQLLADEHYNEQITGIVVDSRAAQPGVRGPQLALATDRAGGRIVWGSPIGDEIEENTLEQKLHLLRSNYRRFGRVDAERPVLDISVHPDRILTPADAAAQRETYAGL